MRIYIYSKVDSGGRGGNISVDMFWFVLLFNTNFMNKLKFNDFFRNLKQNIII